MFCLTGRKTEKERKRKKKKEEERRFSSPSHNCFDFWSKAVNKNLKRGKDEKKRRCD